MKTTPQQQETGGTTSALPESLQPAPDLLPYLSMSALASSESDHILWSQVLLPLKGEVRLEEATFLASSEELPDTTPKVQRGSCVFFAKASTASHPTSLIAENTKPSDAAGRVFAIMDAQTSRLVGYGIFGDQGTAQCPVLPTHVISTGFGELRLETALTNLKGSVAVHLRPRGTLKFEPRDGQGVRPGDVIRLGREAAKPQFPTGIQQARLGHPLENDLFRQLTSPSSNSGANEFLTTSLLMGENSFAVALEESRYVASIIGPEGNVVCQDSFFLQGGEEHIFQCKRAVKTIKRSPASREPTLLATPQPEPQLLKVDGTIYPPKLTRSVGFRSFLKQRTQSVLESFVENRFPDLKRFYFLMPFESPASASHLGPFLGRFDAAKPFLAENESDLITRIYTASTTNKGDSLSKFLAENLTFMTLPLAGVGEQELSQGATPFLIATRFLTPEISTSSLARSFAYISNGAEISIDHQKPGALLKPPPQQKFRFQIWIPPGNQTEYAALFLNGQIMRQFVVPKSNESDWNTFTIEERIERKEDFELAVAAWGNAFLPEFIYGIKGLTPFAMTRQLCVDVDEDGACSINR